MLENLDTVDWAHVHHAYGEAADTPEFLRMLLDGDPERRQRAYRHLCVTLLEDGLRNQATAAAAPFLVELIGDPRTPDRSRLIDMLTCSVAGTFSIASPPILDDGTPDVHPILREIYRAAEAAVPYCLELVHAADDGSCVAAVYFLATMWRSADQIVPALHGRLARASSATVRAIIAFALGHLQPDEPALLALHEDDPELVVRVIAAVGLLRHPGDAPASAVDAIIAGLDAPDGVPGLDRLPCVELGVADLGRVLCTVPPALGARAVPALCAALRRADGFAVLGMIEPLLYFAFGDPPGHLEDAPPPARDLDAITPAQRHVLGVMLETASLWTIGDLFFLLQAYHLPTSRRSLGAFLGAPVS
ncbi:hypothetical protein [Nannocystis sp. SCPEA4]|uniref:hypothetical protein n=1 Tax=Nannocystis sp. SCPEA4 TaxID=2996787 RepID=UPI00226F427A|nr:hypothetical protein [Nannocystis sp. SCPEA4]MCY1057588.1 hypothetical protein [Nannocystis sp. SCPEA4]